MGGTCKKKKRDSVIDLAHWQSKGQHICIYITSVKTVREYDPIQPAEVSLVTKNMSSNQGTDFA